MFKGAMVAALVLSFSVFGAKAEADTLTLAADGQTAYQIVLPSSSPAPSVEEGLAEVARLAQAAFAANGFEIPIVTEDARDPNRPGIFLGATDFARRAGINLSRLEGYDYVHKAVGRDVIIAGNDRASTIRDEQTNRLNPRDLAQMGTAKAVTDFLREHAGVRFLFPDLGNDLAGSARVDLLASPGLEFLPTSVIAVPTDLDLVKDVPLEYNFWRSRNSHYHVANNMFPLFNTLWSAHSHQNAVPPGEYYDSNPEYFALLGGQRVRGVQYCISNPGFQERNYEYLAAAFDRGYDKVYLGHSDGFRACQCEECYNLYDTGDDWTEKLWIFNRNMAERLYESHPDKTVVLVAYTVTERAAPKSFDAFPPNTMLQMCGTNESDLAKWEGVDIPKGITSYIYSWTPSYVSRYAPMNTPSSIESQMKRLHRHNVKGVYRDTGGPFLYGMEGPVAYVMGRIWDDPENNRADELTLEFIEAAFGDAAAPMRRFYDRLYRGIAVYAEYLGTRLEGWGHVRDGFRQLGFLYPHSLLETLDNELSQAEAAATNERVRARLALVRREFEWIRHTAEVIHLYQAYEFARDDIAIRDRLLDAIDARNAQIEGMYEEGLTHPAWNHVMFPPPGHNANHLRLAYNRYRENFRDTALNWDTDAMRAAPPPGAARLAAEVAGDTVTLDSDRWERVEAEILPALPGQAGDPRKTTLRALHDEEALYLLFECETPADLLRAAAQVSRGDLGDQEAVDVHLAPRPGQAIYYRFKVGPGGARYDGATGLIEDEMHLRYGREDPEWTGDWGADIRLDPENDRWLALLTIPYATLGVEPPSAGMTQWRANFGRVHPAGTDRIERHVWSGVGGMDDPASMGGIDFAHLPLRESLAAMRRRDGYDTPPTEWAGLPNPLPEDAKGEWVFSLDPMERGLRDNWQAVDFDDSGWTAKRVPAWYAETDVGDYQGYAWYRLRFTVPDDWRGKTLRVIFAGVDEQAWVYLNGQLVREHTVESEGMEIGILYNRLFRADAPQETVVPGQENLLAVRVHNSVGQGGIWLPVFIHALDE